eukprot:NODE_243_length_11887_cov_0.520699.p9 type:complete len:183 gc:universal NODE_243_length_11887_cov_0.520699:2962-3510(+)
MLFTLLLAMRDVKPGPGPKTGELSDVPVSDPLLDTQSGTRSSLTPGATELNPDELATQETRQQERDTPPSSSNAERQLEELGSRTNPRDTRIENEKRPLTRKDKIINALLITTIIAGISTIIAALAAWLTQKAIYSVSPNDKDMPQEAIPNPKGGNFPIDGFQGIQWPVLQDHNQWNMQTSQ